ncbi:hypothetical protein C8P68_102490 [Mucilaginibacter yixingensis]|uniref:Uncharacterized protein n=1 Tax=Mucilaginibacter yixingensis TaxID=1295612 RepID=A0A2T5JD23_9SPHI|nr:hypothetical protein [Mucilaginibacter yixingensis]PTQ99662.1 hypothetical protein C8P68_102490 [Mucilaginibacter yixingensis]
MYPLDFLYYHITYWFEQHPEKLTWSTPQQRAAYALGLVILCWGWVLDSYLVSKHVLEANVSRITFLAVGLAIMYLLQYIYIDKGRYAALASGGGFKISKNTGVVVTFVFLFLSFLLPFITLPLFYKFGSARLH